MAAGPPMTHGAPITALESTRAIDATIDRKTCCIAYLPLQGRGAAASIAIFVPQCRYTPLFKRMRQGSCDSGDVRCKEFGHGLAGKIVVFDRISYGTNRVEPV